MTVAPYLWATSMDGNATVGGIKSDVDVPFSDLLKDLSFGAMMLVDVAKGPFGIGVNGLFARVSPDSDVGGVKIDTTSDTVQLGVAPYYRVVDWAYRTSPSGRPLRVAPEAGFRFTYLRAELEVRGARTSIRARAGSSRWSARASGWTLPTVCARHRGQYRRLWGRLGSGVERPGLNYKTSVFGLATTFASATAPCIRTTITMTLNGT